MTLDEAVARVVDALNGAGIPFMLVGSFSSNYYGVPRATRDVDIVVETAGPLTDAFVGSLGADFEAEQQQTFETETGTQRQELSIKGTIFKIEMFRLSPDPHDQERFRRRQEVLVQGHEFFFPRAEDVIIWKLRWARSKDREDVRAVIGVQQERLDWAYIERWCDRHGTRAVLEEIRRSVPKA